MIEFTEEWFLGQYAAIPAHMQESIMNYVLRKIPVGNFLKAVICNNLREAVGYADEENLPLLKIYVQWFYNVCPANLVGKENYLDHISRD